MLPHGQENLGHSRFSSLSHRGPILAFKKRNWYARADLYLKEGGGGGQARNESSNFPQKSSQARKKTPACFYTKLNTFISTDRVLGSHCVYYVWINEGVAANNGRSISHLKTKLIEIDVQYRECSFIPVTNGRMPGSLTEIFTPPR